MRRDDEEVYFQKQIKESLDFFEAWLYPNTYRNLTYNGVPIKKSLFIDKLAVLSHINEEYKHNCLPCNLTDGANLILSFLVNNLNCTNIRYFTNLYSILLYQQAERLGVIYYQLDYKTNNEFDWSQFPNLQTIKYWANFFKHPKSSLFIHHPTFHIESYPNNPNIMYDGNINSEFVKKYFSGRKFNEELKSLLLNKNFKIFFPDLIKYTKLICTESDFLISTILSNEDNIEKLKCYSTTRFF
jgi:hypothetical protein